MRVHTVVFLVFVVTLTAQGAAAHGQQVEGVPSGNSPQSMASPVSVGGASDYGDLEPAVAIAPAGNEGSESGLVEPASFSSAFNAGSMATPASKKYPTVALTGFFQADTAYFDQSAANIEAVGDIQNGADFRRARLAAVGQAYENVGYMIEFDFAFPGRPSFMDVWMELQDLPTLQNLRIGHYRQPFNMDALTSVKELTFLERALPFAFLPFRQMGIMTFGTTEDESGTYAASVFRFPTDFYGGQVGDSGGFGLATRLTRLLIDGGDGEILHIGGDFAFIDPSNDAVRYANTPEIFVSETGGGVVFPDSSLTFVPPFVDTGVIPTQNVALFDAELAAVSGSATFQSEYVHATVNRRDAGTVNFDGAYAQATYILTGETRPYNHKGGVLGRIVPNCPFTTAGGSGAWEIAGRWSYLNLNDSNIRGGRLTDLTAGLNWYLNKNAKFQFNYIHAFLDSPVNGDSDADIFAARAQVDF